MTLRLVRSTTLAVLALLVCSGIMLYAASPSSAQAVIYVDNDASGANDGSSWADAFTDLRGALPTSQSGDEVWVAQGTYTPISSENPSSTERELSFELVDGVGLYGGFDGTEDAREERDPEPATNGTVLSGEIGDQDNLMDNSYSVVTSGGVSDTTILDGFTITGGFANSNSTVQGRGGGMNSGDGDPRLRNLAFEENTARSFGGGLHSESGSLELSNVTFTNNEVTASFGDGGGMSSNQNSEAVLTDITFIGNTAARNGGGLYSDRSTFSLTDVTFEENEAANGGGMYNDRGSVTMQNGVFEGNTATDSGGGAYNTGNSANGDFRFDGVSFTENVAGDGGGMFSLGGGANPTANTTVVDSTFTGNEAEDSGGGMANSKSSATVTETTFSSNTAGDSGGGMNNDGGTPTITDTVFSDNEAAFGGGMQNTGSSPSLTNVEFLDNRAVSGGDDGGASGGGIGNTSSDPTITNALFSGNSATDGGAIHNFGSGPTIANSTFSRNTATENGGGVFNLRQDEGEPSSPVIQNSILWNNSAGVGGDEISNDGGTPTARHSIVRGGLPDGTADGGDNFDEDPLFADPENGDFRLQTGSPAINRGDNDLIPQGVETDLDGNPRIFDGKIVDLGAYEFQANQAPTVDDKDVQTDEDTELEITLTGSDADGDALSFEIVNGPSDGTLGETGPVVCSGDVPNECEATIAYTPDQNFEGADAFTYFVNDGTEDSETVAVEISVRAVNDAPTVELAGEQSANEGDTKTYAFTVNDPDAGDSFEVSDGFPDCGESGVFADGSLQTDSDGGSFDCSFPDGPARTVVSVQVEDSGAETSNLAERTVGVENVKPSISLFGPDFADEGDTEVYTYTVTDPGDDTHAVETACGENGEKVEDSDAFDQQSGEGSFRCLFPAGPAATEVSATATDSDGARDTDDQRVRVMVDNIAPTVELSGDETADEGETKTYTFTVADPGDDAQSISTSCGERGEKVSDSDAYDAQSGEGSFDCFFPDGPSSTVVSVESNDGNGTGRDEKTVEISNVAPTVEALSGRSAVRNGPVYTYTFTVMDPGSDNIAYADGYPDCGENARLVGEPEARSFRCRFTGNGSSVVSVAVEDSDGAISNIESRRVEISPSINSPCTIKGDGKRNVLRGTSGDDVICGLGGNDVIRGLGGDDVIKGGGGRDVIYGGPGDDLLFGGPGDDALYGGPGKDRLVGGPGKNRLKQ